MAGWGLVSLDWSNGIHHWLNKDRNKSTCDATNIFNAAQIKVKTWKAESDEDAGHQKKNYFRCLIFLACFFWLNFFLKRTSPGTRVFVYRNLELSLQWIEAQRKYMYDPNYAHMFLQYTDGT
jgi:hypothetical protein